jgi:hypothetical protein
VWIGLALGAAISIKSLVGIVLIPIALALLAGRRLWPIVAGAGAAAALHFALWLPWGASDVWDQAYAYHLDVAGSRTPGANLAKTLSTLGDRDLPLVAAVVLAVGAAGLATRRRRTPPPPEPATPAGQDRVARLAGWLQHPDVLLGTWLAATVLMLVTEHPMWRPHVAHLVPPLALLLARHRPPARALAAVLVLSLPYHLVHAWEVLHPTPYRGISADTIDTLHVLPDGALAISDDPGIVWRAGRRTTDDLVDTSILRIQTDRMDVESVVAAAVDPQVCAVVVRSAVRWGSFTDLPTRLELAGYVLTRAGAGGRGIYLKPSCRP